MSVLGPSHWSHDCHPGRNPLLKKQLPWEKKTKDTGYQNHVLRSDETEVNSFGLDSDKVVMLQPGEQYKYECVFPTVKPSRVGKVIGLGVRKCCQY